MRHFRYTAIKHPVSLPDGGGGEEPHKTMKRAPWGESGSPPPEGKQREAIFNCLFIFAPFSHKWGKHTSTVFFLSCRPRFVSFLIVFFCCWGLSCTHPIPEWSRRRRPLVQRSRPAPPAAATPASSSSSGGSQQHSSWLSSPTVPPKNN